MAGRLIGRLYKLIMIVLSGSSKSVSDCEDKTLWYLGLLKQR